jgi:hypothetical protein
MEEKKLAAEAKEAQRQAQRAAQIEAHKAAKRTHVDVPDDEGLVAPQLSKKVNMFNEFRAPRKNN